MEKRICESCGKYFYVGANKKSKLRNSQKCPSCRGGIPPWTKEEIDLLVSLRRYTDKTLEEIGKEIGRTREACSNKLVKLRVRKDFLGDYRKIRCILCGKESGRFSLTWHSLIKDKYICHECRKYFGRTKIIDDVIFISINKDLYYPLHYLVWLLAGETLPYKKILAHKDKKSNNDIENLILTSARGEKND